MLITSIAFFQVAYAIDSWPGLRSSYIKGDEETFDLSSDMRADRYAENKWLKLQQVSSSIPTNLLYPGEQVEVKFHIQNRSNEALRLNARAEVIHYGMLTPDHNKIFEHRIYKINDCKSSEVSLRLKAGEAETISIKPNIPETKGGYAIVFDFGKYGRFWGTSCARIFKADETRKQFPQFSLDEEPAPVLERLGAQAIRKAFHYNPTTDRNYGSWYKEKGKELNELDASNITVLATVWWGTHRGPTQPLGFARPHLKDNGVMKNSKKPDAAWSPEYDEDFKQWVKKIAGEYGWPKGPITAFALWNEPWEGSSIDFWGADMIRFREIYTKMAEGVEEAREEYGVQVLLGGCDSTSNTFDKLFPDGKDTFLARFDVCTVHYQGMDVPTLYKKWINRKESYGRVQVWDTESWMANSDERISAYTAGALSAGLDRTLGVLHRNMVRTVKVKVKTNRGREKYTVQEAWSPCAPYSATTHFIGERKFKKLVFRNGLPSVFHFENKTNPDDSVLIVVGDLGKTCGEESRAFRNIAINEDAVMKISDQNGLFACYDYYGNPVAASDGILSVPLNSQGFFLKSNAADGSFKRLLKEVKQAELSGIEPIDVVVKDMLQPIELHPELQLTVTNVLNKPLSGKLKAKLNGLLLAPSELDISLKANETVTVSLQVSGNPDPTNLYKLSAIVDCGKSGIAEHTETIRVNTIDSRTVTVDGKLDDWKGTIAQTIISEGEGVSLTEAAWIPFEKIGSENTKINKATARLAYDEDFFYFAAEVYDETQCEGAPRFEKLDHDSFFYPKVSFKEKNGKREEFVWPENIRRYSYRKKPFLPSGDAPSIDNIQIAFNAVSIEDEAFLSHPKGTRPGWIAYPCTDHEYALNKVAEEFGGGTEIRRLAYPGMPRKHQYPRQPASPFDGSVNDGELTIRYEGTTRIVECAIPWSEMPKVHERMKQGKTVKFSFRVNNNKGPSFEYAAKRSVSKGNFYAFHAEWKKHWANEVEFSFSPQKTTQLSEAE